MITNKENLRSLLSNAGAAPPGESAGCAAIPGMGVRILDRNGFYREMITDRVIRFNNVGESRLALNIWDTLDRRLDILIEEADKKLSRAGADIFITAIERAKQEAHETIKDVSLLPL